MPGSGVAAGLRLANRIVPVGGRSMPTECEKMLAGELYDPLDPELVRARDRARDLCQDLNATREARPGGPPPHPDGAVRRGAARRSGCSRRSSATTGRTSCSASGCFFNFNCVVLDVCRVTIGDFTLFGPAVQIYTATHPMNAELRRKQEFGKPIEIGSDVWVGGGAIICPGVTIGSRTVIGAGSVVTRDIPAACSPPATRAGSSGRSPSERLHGGTLSPSCGGSCRGTHNAEARKPRGGLERARAPAGAGARAREASSALQRRFRSPRNKDRPRWDRSRSS